jgi:chemotaxis protein methyltransferase CheR
MKLLQLNSAKPRYPWMMAISENINQYSWMAGDTGHPTEFSKAWNKQNWKLGEEMHNLSDDDFIKLSEFTRQRFGIDLSQKKSMVESRLQSYLNRRGYESFPAFYKFLINDKTGMEAKALADRLSTNYTFFMREVEHFHFFRETILPYLAATVKSKDLRIWSAGCSSGEEAYTLAMIVNDYFGKDRCAWDKKILATDISTRALEIALQATYSDEQIKDLPGIWKMNYFEPVPNGKRLVKSIRDEVIFRRFNLMEKTFPFKQKFHVIFCRNVMIYFDNETKIELVNRFYDCTAPGGYLIIGHSETLNRSETNYQYVMPAVYRKG